MNLITVLVISSIWAAPVSIAPDRMAEVDGKRTFILGLYENPKEDAVLQRVATAGFNLVQTTEDPAGLDRLQKAGLHAWINTGARIDFSETPNERAAALQTLVQQCAGHPALLAWEVPDEALWNCWYTPMGWRRGDEPKQQRDLIAKLTDVALAKKLSALRDEADAYGRLADYANEEKTADLIWAALGQKQPHPGLNISTAAQRESALRAGFVAGYRRLKELDPQHPVWMNFAPRNNLVQLAGFANGADALGCDIYPVPFGYTGHSDLANSSLSSVGAYTDRMQQAGPKKPVWMVLQAFGWGDIQAELTADQRALRRRPTYDESRFMAYDAIVHGARGILYWGTMAIEKDSTLWNDLMKVVRELADLQPVLSAPDAGKAPKVQFEPGWASLDQKILVLPKKVQGKNWYIVVNENPSPLRYTLSGIKAPNGQVYRDTHDKREATVQKGALTMGIAPTGVQVLEPVS